MSRFEDNLDKLREYHDGGYDDTMRGLLTIADGLAELIALLRPAVDVLTAKPEPLEIRSSKLPPMCLAGDPGSNGFRRCGEPYGHDGDHRHRDGLNAGVEYVWTQRHGDVPKPCGAEFTGGTDTDPWSVLCVRHRGHEGRHMDAAQVYGPGAHMDADASGTTW